MLPGTQQTGGHLSHTSAHKSLPGSPPVAAAAWSASSPSSRAFFDNDRSAGPSAAAATDGGDYGEWPAYSHGGDDGDGGDDEPLPFVGPMFSGHGVQREKYEEEMRHKLAGLSMQQRRHPSSFSSSSSSPPPPPPPPQLPKAGAGSRSVAGVADELSSPDRHRPLFAPFATNFSDPQRNQQALGMVQPSPFAPHQAIPSHHSNHHHQLQGNMRGQTPSHAAPSAKYVYHDHPANEQHRHANRSDQRPGASQPFGGVGGMAMHGHQGQQVAGGRRLADRFRRPQSDPLRDLCWEGASRLSCVFSLQYSFARPSIICLTFPPSPNAPRTARAVVGMGRPWGGRTIAAAAQGSIVLVWLRCPGPVQKVDMWRVQQTGCRRPEQRVNGFRSRGSKRHDL
ncbi:unnamed protein product [Vitrella brassicaformis CCMP3155]|uniref:Uncharacterized protein n=1 Tax=Vitrella brassicaformis (strain CCMP3155) TaxID=1169540 RepID=A0A0G4G5R9_VITBC|nr:unnamed protein product [Vitrella brassicaformis CCMP3155]|eukprot:CEM23420.1 unnamed protein product [Vitrella brassicaformis CCMP3155]